MIPYFFGRAEHRLFGVYQPPAARSLKNRAAVICQPWDEEYLYAHRSMRLLANRLSDIGYHTLRFDYFGSGDSGGEIGDANLACWDGDLEAAIEEIANVSGAAAITLIGLRLGGVVAANVALRLRERIDALVLWDPVVDGDQYLRALGFDAAAAEARQHSVPLNSAEMIERRGFLLTRRMLADLRSTNLVSFLANPPVRTLMVVSERLAAHDQLNDSGGGKSLLSVDWVPDVRPWVEETVNRGIVPFVAIGRIVKWLR